MNKSPATLVVEQVGVLCTIQDRGRFGYRQDGVPWSGTLNPGLATIANALVGNSGATPVLEFFAAGPRLTVSQGSVRIAVAGACHLTIHRGEKKQFCRGWRSLLLMAGDRLEIGPLFQGRVGYVAVAGGFALTPVLGSCSTYTRAAFGGLDGKPLRRGSRLPLTLSAPPAGPNLCLGEPQLPIMPGSQRVDLSLPALKIRVMAGAQADYFRAESLEQFYRQPYTVSKDSDRMGMRLVGAPLVHRSVAHKDIASEGMVPGCIQVPGHGQPIAMLADCATVGGYPKIATIIAADLPKLGLLPPGGKVLFEQVGLAEAQRLAAAEKQAITRQVGAIRPLPVLAEPFA